MIDIDKYEGHTKHGEDWKYYWTQGNGGDNWTMINIKHQDALLLRDAPLLLAEVKRLRKQLEDCKRQIHETADFIRDRGERLHATDLDNFLEWME